MKNVEKTEGDEGSQKKEKRYTRKVGKGREMSMKSSETLKWRECG